jgi:hypothetical protein
LRMAGALWVRCPDLCVLARLGSAYRVYRAVVMSCAVAIGQAAFLNGSDTLANGEDGFLQGPGRCPPRPYQHAPPAPVPDALRGGEWRDSALSPRGSQRPARASCAAMM